MNYETARLGELCDVVRGGSPRPMGDPKYFNGAIPFLKIADVTKVSGKYVYDSQTKVNHLGAEKSRLLPKDTLVLTNSGTVCIPKFLGVDACIHDGFVAFQGFRQPLNLTYLYHFFDYTRPYVVQKYKQGVTQVNLNIEIVSDFEIPLPGVEEQERIVAKIEELFSELDAGVESLKKARAQLKTYRQSVLKHAFEGRLTLGNGELDAMWKPFRLGEISEVRLGRQRSPKHAHGDHLRPYLRAANITWVGLDLIDVKRMNFTPKEQETYKLKAGDVLLNEASGSISEVGKAAIWNDSIEDCCFQNTIIRVRPSELVSSKFLRWRFYYDAISENFRRIARGVGIHHLGATALSNWEVLIPPRHSQDEVVTEIEKRLSLSDKLEESIEAGLIQSEALRQSILKKAFEGKLVK